MARSGNNVTFVHFSLIFFVMLSVILGVLSYLNIDKVSELRKKAEDEKKRADKHNTDFVLLQKAFDALKNKAGYPEVLPDPARQNAPTSPLARLKVDLQKYGENSTLRAVLLSLLNEVDKRDNQIKTATEDQSKKITALTAQLNQAQRDYATADQNLKTAQAEIVKIRNDQQERLRNQRTQIIDLQAEVKKKQGEIQLLEEKQNQLVRDYEKKIRNLEQTIALKQDIIDKLLNVSFEQPDGVVRWVDHRTGLVWINLGSEDKLPEKMTFSVYRQEHNGIARDSDHYKNLKRLMERDARSSKHSKALPEDDSAAARSDIIGSIEVTRIVGPHLSEARILNNDLYNPIRPGNPIYTPLWSPGVELSFAFAVYLDGIQFNGLDRNLLFRIVKAAGANISNYIDDEGKLIGTGITDKDKFLVVTDIPDPRGTADPKERKRRENMAASRLTMEQQARRYGVRVVRLSDFLSYIGYHPDRRLWRPGDHPQRKLKAGAHSTTVNETVGRRESSGQTSGIYTRRGRLKQPKSTGQTSKVFGGTRGY